VEGNHPRNAQNQSQQCPGNNRDIQDPGKPLDFMIAKKADDKRVQAVGGDIHHDNLDIDHEFQGDAGEQFVKKAGPGQSAPQSQG
jgi:hypothetical protein